MKTISFVVPCYNSAFYMEHCIESLLPAGEDAEIILINDGSTDSTGAICERYAAAYPHIVRVHHQKNGGHGEGVNQGLQLAQGMYFKVMDSDDWADAEALQQVMKTLRHFLKSSKPVDLLIVNYVYEKVQLSTSKAMRYRNAFPIEKTFKWSEVRFFLPSQYLLMHSAFYRTDVLRKSRLILPKHTFYVDNLFVYQPLPFVQTLYYLDVDYYRYYIGRADQSVNEQVMVGRIDQQIQVTQIMLCSHDLWALKKSERKLAKYMYRYLVMMMIICSVFLLLGGTDKHLQKRNELWQYVAAYDSGLYRKLKYFSLASFTMLPGKLGRAIGVASYRLSQKFCKFN